ncbi:hypothetical protein COY27_06335 [Candidatus Woesearchaeota archaeon CG_4_10_14_0_2_um_filter_33_13]|nr:MAG: hypothetical protein COY27_06335 [Candidatus Woesearchaeota archaeon CG_4_10_14_0_2_um_filter_33_13]
MNQQKQQNILKFIFLLSILGIMVSGYLTFIHYSVVNSPCDFSKTFQCTLVSQSKYAEFFGIPVALIGLAGYAILGLISGITLWITKNNLNFKVAFLRYMFRYKTIFYTSLIATGISLYLTYAEFFLINALCIFCLISQLIVIIIATLSYVITTKDSNKNGGLLSCQ